MCDVCKAEAAAAPAAAAGAGAAAAATAAAAAEQARDVSEAAQGVLETLASKAGEERRATLVQLLSKWRSNKVSGRALCFSPLCFFFFLRTLSWGCTSACGSGLAFAALPCRGL